MQISTIGIDLAKNVFQVHGVDAAEKLVLKKQLRRSQVLEFFSKLSPCLVGMEACATSHQWARELKKLGPSRFSCARPNSMAKKISANSCGLSWPAIGEFGRRCAGGGGGRIFHKFLSTTDVCA